MSDGLSVIIVILIIGIVLDGIRRARNSRRNEIRLSKNARKADKLFSEDESLKRSGEFPSGGARSRDERRSRDRYIEEASGNENLSAPVYQDPVQAPLDLDDPVPMLMESVTAEPVEKDSVDIGPIIENDEQITEQNSESFNDVREPSIGALDNIDALVEVEADKPHGIEEKEKTTKSKLDIGSQLFSQKKPKIDEPQEGPKSSGEQEILIINVMARSGAQFAGGMLLNALTEQSLKFGQMGIFHRHLDNDGDAPVVYSLANIVEPGSFDFARMNDSITPGVCIFLSLPTVCDGASAYDDMVNTAKNLAYILDGELKDENRSALTNQTIEYDRQRVMEFERKYKLKK